jgi:hypothetical protein
MLYPGGGAITRYRHALQARYLDDDAMHAYFERHRLVRHRWDWLYEHWFVVTLGPEAATEKKLRRAWKRVSGQDRTTLGPGSPELLAFRGAHPHRG